jgi:hypothetical protein
LVSTYEVIVERGDRFWLVRVPAIGHVTQARSLREVDPMARDLIAVMSADHISPDELELNVQIRLPDTVQKHLDRVQQLRQQAASAQAEAAAESRSAARELAKHGLTYRDIGGALGVSHQRAEQLVKSR